MTQLMHAAHSSATRPNHAALDEVHVCGHNLLGRLNGSGAGRGYRCRWPAHPGDRSCEERLTACTSRVQMKAPALRCDACGVIPPASGHTCPGGCARRGEHVKAPKSRPTRASRLDAACRGAAACDPDCFNRPGVDGFNCFNQARTPGKRGAKMTPLCTEDFAPKRALSCDLRARGCLCSSDCCASTSSTSW